MNKIFQTHLCIFKRTRCKASKNNFHWFFALYFSTSTLFFICIWDGIFDLPILCWVSGISCKSRIMLTGSPLLHSFFLILWKSWVDLFASDGSVNYAIMVNIVNNSKGSKITYLQTKSLSITKEFLIFQYKSAKLMPKFAYSTTIREKYYTWSRYSWSITTFQFSI